MGSRGTTFAKQDRDRAKKAKATLKREKRFDKDSSVAPGDEEAAVVDDTPAEELLRLVEQLHRDYDDGQISLDDFDEKKAALMARISVT